MVIDECSLHPIGHQGFWKFFDVNMEHAIFQSLLDCLFTGCPVGVEKLADGLLGSLVVARGNVVDNAIVEICAIAVKEGIGVTPSTC